MMQVRQVIPRHGSPALAGIDLTLRGMVLLSLRFPRTRGDRPDKDDDGLIQCPVPPHSRG